MRIRKRRRRKMEVKEEAWFPSLSIDVLNF